MNKTLTVLVCLSLIAGLLLGALTYALIQGMVTITNRGIIIAIGVEVYQDANLTYPLRSIDWGVLSPGETKTFKAWIKNTGNFPERLVMWSEGWQPPAASNWIRLSWNYDGESWIQPGDSIAVVFTLSVDPAIIGITNFSFEVWIKGVT